MTDYLTRLAERALGLAHLVRPAVAPRFAPSPMLWGEETVEAQSQDTALPRLPIPRRAEAIRTEARPGMLAQAAERQPTDAQPAPETSGPLAQTGQEFAPRSDDVHEIAKASAEPIPAASFVPPAPAADRDSGQPPEPRTTGQSSPSRLAEAQADAPTGEPEAITGKRPHQTPALETSRDHRSDASTAPRDATGEPSPAAGRSGRIVFHGRSQPSKATAEPDATPLRLPREIGEPVTSPLQNAAPSQSSPTLVSAHGEARHTELDASLRWQDGDAKAAPSPSSPTPASSHGEARPNALDASLRWQDGTGEAAPSPSSPTPVSTHGEARPNALDASLRWQDGAGEAAPSLSSPTPLSTNGEARPNALDASLRWQDGDAKATIVADVSTPAAPSHAILTEASQRHGVDSIYSSESDQSRQPAAYLRLPSEGWEPVASPAQNAAPSPSSPSPTPAHGEARSTALDAGLRWQDVTGDAATTVDESTPAAPSHPKPTEASQRHSVASIFSSASEQGRQPTPYSRHPRESGEPAPPPIQNAAQSPSSPPPASAHDEARPTALDASLHWQDGMGEAATTADESTPAAPSHPKPTEASPRHHAEPLFPNISEQSRQPAASLRLPSDGWDPAASPVQNATPSPSPSSSHGEARPDALDASLRWQDGMGEAAIIADVSTPAAPSHPKPTEASPLRHANPVANASEQSRQPAAPSRHPRESGEPVMSPAQDATPSPSSPMPTPSHGEARPDALDASLRWQDGMGGAAESPFPAALSARRWVHRDGPVDSIGRISQHLETRFERGRAEQSQQQPAQRQIQIDRIDLRMPALPLRSAPRRKARRPVPSMSLDDYLSRRSARRS